MATDIEILHALIMGIVIGACLRHILQLILDAQIKKIKNGYQPIPGHDKNGNPPKEE